MGVVRLNLDGNKKDIKADDDDTIKDLKIKNNLEDYNFLVDGIEQGDDLTIKDIFSDKKQRVFNLKKKKSQIPIKDPKFELDKQKYDNLKSPSNTEYLKLELPPKKIIPTVGEPVFSFNKIDQDTVKLLLDGCNFLFGYGSNHKTAVKRIFNFKGFTQEMADYIRPYSGSQVQITDNHFTSMEEIQTRKEWYFGANAEVDMKIVGKIKSQLKLESTKETKTETRYTYHLKENQYSLAELIFREIRTPTTDFLKFFSKKSITFETIQDFYQTYGIYVPNKVTIGAMIYEEEKIVSNFGVIADQGKVGVGLGVNLKNIADIGVDAGIATNSTEKYAFHKRDYALSCKGGESGLVNDPEKWKTSFTFQNIRLISVDDQVLSHKLLPKKDCDRIEELLKIQLDHTPRETINHKSKIFLKYRGQQRIGAPYFYNSSYYSVLDNDPDNLCVHEIRLHNQPEESNNLGASALMSKSIPLRNGSTIQIQTLASFTGRKNILQSGSLGWVYYETLAATEKQLWTIHLVFNKKGQEYINDGDEVYIRNKEWTSNNYLYTENKDRRDWIACGKVQATWTIHLFNEIKISKKSCCCVIF